MTLQTTCPKGHVFDAYDLYMDWPEGAPHCPTCFAEWRQERIPKLPITVSIKLSTRSPKTSLQALSFTMGNRKPLSFDQLIVGFAVNLATFMLNDPSTSEEDLLASAKLASMALANMEIGEK